MNLHMNDHVSAENSKPLRPGAARIHAVSSALIVTNAAVYLFLAVAIVPYWQTLSGAEIQSWFGEHFGRFAPMMVPVHMLAIVTTLAAAWVHRGRTGTDRILWVIVVVGLLVSQAFNFTVYAQSLNPDLTSGELTAAAALDTLDTWDSLHLVRTAFVIISAVATMTLAATAPTKAKVTS